MAETYICYGCGWKSSMLRTKPGQFLCNECLKIWEGGKFYSHPKGIKNNDENFKKARSPIGTGHDHSQQKNHTLFGE